MAATNDAGIGKNFLAKARKSKEKLGESARLFKEFLGADEAQDPSKYYLARNRLQEGQALLADVLNEARKWLGPPPDYASEEAVRERMRLLHDARVLTESPTLDGLEAELLADEYVKSFMNSDKIVHYVHEAGTDEAAGKRKLQNLKVRMIIDELDALAVEGRDLQRQAGDKMQAKR